MLHGAGGDADQVLPMVTPSADAEGLLIVAPAARGRTWDLILGGYGPDVRFIDRVLAQVFARYAVDPHRVAIGGFSDLSAKIASRLAATACTSTSALVGFAGLSR